MWNPMFFYSSQIIFKLKGKIKFYFSIKASDFDTKAVLALNIKWKIPPRREVSALGGGCT
jgi:hypothetical protein